MRWSALLVCVACALPAAVWADELTPQKAADIRQLIGATNRTHLAAQLADGAARGLAAMLKKSPPEAVARATKAIRQELVTVFEQRMDTTGGLVESLVAIYHKHFTHAEVKELLAFYATPIGRKTIEVLPAVTNESMAAGEAWAQGMRVEIRQRVRAALKKEGLELPRTR